MTEIGDLLLDVHITLLIQHRLIERLGVPSSAPREVLKVRFKVRDSPKDCLHSISGLSQRAVRSPVVLRKWYTLSSQGGRLGRGDADLEERAILKQGERETPWQEGCLAYFSWPGVFLLGMTSKVNCHLCGRIEPKGGNDH